MIKLLAGVAVATLLHITPTVILVKRPAAVEALLPGATAFFARDAHLSDADAHRLHEQVDWSPDDGVLTFYDGKAGDRIVGTLTFVRIDTPHGPVEVAVGFKPDGTIRDVIVTKATVETKPWVVDAVGAGLTAHYTGLKSGDAPAGAAAIRARVGSLPHFMAQEVDKGVARALAAYGTFYHGHVRA